MKKLHQESGNNSKPEFIFGHSCQAVGLIVHAAASFMAIPLACRIHEMHDGGDHWIVVGDVLDMHRSDAEPWPLLFFGGRYHHPSRMAGKHLDPAADPYT